MRDRSSVKHLAGGVALCLCALALSCGNEQCCPCPTDEADAQTVAAPEEPAKTDVKPPTPPVEPTPAPAPAAEPTPPGVVAPLAGTEAGQLVAANGLTLANLVIAKGVEKRQPVEPGTSFAVPRSGRLYVLFDVINLNLVEDELAVTWLNPKGKEVGKVTLTVVAKDPKWRTWAFHSNVRVPGHWEAIIRTADGQELGRVPFDITP